MSKTFPSRHLIPKIFGRFPISWNVVLLFFFSLSGSTTTPTPPHMLSLYRRLLFATPLRRYPTNFFFNLPRNQSPKQLIYLQLFSLSNLVMLVFRLDRNSLSYLTSCAFTWLQCWFPHVDTECYIMIKTRNVTSWLRHGMLHSYQDMECYIWIKTRNFHSQRPAVILKRAITLMDMWPVTILLVNILQNGADTKLARNAICRGVSHWWHPHYVARFVDCLFL